MKQFEIPTFYRSSHISSLKQLRKTLDPRKKDFQPALLDFGPLKIYLARHFGFCYGVENAIEIAYKSIEENPGKRIYMLSQMIHNPTVNQDLEDRGLRFIQDTSGNLLRDWEEITSDDIVIIPAFGTTLETEAFLENKGIQTARYNTTCPFVEKVWKMAQKLGGGQYTIIIHGKHSHEETRATFSHSQAESPSVVIKNIDEARIIGDIILQKRPASDFAQHFAGRASAGFDPERDLSRVGVINQTTMLASETHEIAEYFKSVMAQRYNAANLSDHFADTRDTLCYATNDNQDSTYELLKTDADLAIVVGGYNSSNTSHIVDLLETRFPTFFVNGPDEIKSQKEIHHFDYHGSQHRITTDFLPAHRPVNLVITSGASCPDSVVEAVIQKLCSFFPDAEDLEKVFASFQSDVK